MTQTPNALGLFDRLSGCCRSMQFTENKKVVCTGAGGDVVLA